MSKSRYLVTGGTGFLGCSLVRSLLTGGHFVRVLDNNSRGKLSSLNDILKDIDFQEGDIRDPVAVEKACRGVDSICHLAYVNGTEYFYSKPDLVLDVGVKGMLNVLDGALKHKVAEFMLMSSSEVYQNPDHVPTDESVSLSVPDPLNPRYSYGGGKIISELLAINYGRRNFQRVTIIRPHNVYGPQMGFEHVIPQFIIRMKKLISQRGRDFDFEIQGTGQETRAFVYIDDFTQGVMKVLEKGEHLNIYHIGREEEVAISSIAQMLAQYFNVRINIKPTELLKGSVSRRCPSLKKVESLGYHSQISLSEGLKRTANWYSNLVLDSSSY